jgi:alkylation response protein AidB-like acyl-CoA dehydrogenase
MSVDEHTITADLSARVRALLDEHDPADTCARGDADAPVAAAVAAAYCGDVAVHAAEECIQLHGGIGMTWEYPAHLYLKRAKSDQLAFGTGYRHRARLAELVDLSAS